MESLGDILSYILKQFHNFIPDSELEESILKYIPVPSNVPPSAPLGDFLRGVLKKNHKSLELQGHKLLQKSLSLKLLCNMVLSN